MVSARMRLVHAGAVLSTFWWRRCTEQSRSHRCTTFPLPSPMIWISMCRGRSTKRSMKTEPSPKEALASDEAELKNGMRSSTRRT